MTGSPRGFAPLLVLEIRHDYHGSGPAPIGLEPDAATVRLARRPDLRLRLTEGVAELFADADRTALRAVAAAGELVLTLRLRPRDPALAAVTDVIAGARDRVAVIDSRDRLAGGPVSDGDLQGLAPGEIVTPADVARPPLAIVRLPLDPDAVDEVRVLRFGAVARHWTYHVVGGATDAAFGIRDRANLLGFEPLGPRLMSNGARAQSFRSSAPIPERARPEARFELVSEGPFGPRVVMSTLPCPRPGPGTLDPGGAAASEILVNLC